MTSKLTIREFVKSCDPSMTDKQIVDEAQEHGLALDARQVYNIRYQAGQKDSAAAPISSRLMQIYEFIKTYVKAHSEGPTSMAIAESIGCSSGSISIYMKTLKRRGFIDYEGGSYKGVRSSKRIRRRRR